MVDRLRGPCRVEKQEIKMGITPLFGFQIVRNTLNSRVYGSGLKFKAFRLVLLTMKNPAL